MKKHRKSRVLGSKISLISGVFIFIPLTFHFFHSAEAEIFHDLVVLTNHMELVKNLSSQHVQGLQDMGNGSF